jgi:hypothetical protein
MARDIVLGRTPRNWARGVLPAPTPTSDEVTVRLTEAEMSMLAEVAATKARAEAGDRGARSRMAKLASKIASLKKKASRGHEPSRRTLLVLRESGVFQGTQSITLGNERVSNVDYRIAVLRQARRAAGNRSPTTRDFARAKSDVDGTMRRAGIALFMPGSRPGRVTH